MTGSFAGGLQLITAFGVLALVLSLLITRNTTWARNGRTLPDDVKESAST